MEFYPIKVYTKMIEVQEWIRSNPDISRILDQSIVHDNIQAEKFLVNSNVKLEKKVLWLFHKI